MRFEPTNFTVRRTMPDGLVEIVDGRGMVRRVKFQSCIECQRSLPEYLFLQNLIGRDQWKVCADCQHSEVALRNSAKKQRIKSLGESQKSTERRYVALVRATPSWRDKAKIAAVYEECKRRTRETGITHHVDHYYPIQGEFSSGLHVHQNLRIITAKENWSKKNRDPLEEWMLEA